MYNFSLFIVTTNHKGEGQVSYKYNKHVRQLKSLHLPALHLGCPHPYSLSLAVNGLSNTDSLLSLCLLMVVLSRLSQRYHHQCSVFT